MGMSFSNCSFQNIASSYKTAPVISAISKLASFNITNCIFLNISNNHEKVRGGCIEFLMDRSLNGDYSFTGNSFKNIISHNSGIFLEISFKSLNFSKNCFVNVSSSDNAGGVLFYFLLVLLSI
jgi:hypothetical protein